MKKNFRKVISLLCVVALLASSLTSVLSGAIFASAADTFYSGVYDVNLASLVPSVTLGDETFENIYKVQITDSSSATGRPALGFANDDNTGYYEMELGKTYYLAYDMYIASLTGAINDTNLYYGKESNKNGKQVLSSNSKNSAILQSTDFTTVGTWQTREVRFTYKDQYVISNGNGNYDCKHVFLTIYPKGAGTSFVVYFKNFRIYEADTKVTYYDNGQKYVEYQNAGDTFAREGENACPGEQFMGWYSTPDFTTEDNKVLTVPASANDGHTVSLFARYPSTVIDFNQLGKIYNSSSDTKAAAKASGFTVANGEAAVSMNAGSGFMIPAYDYKEYSADGPFYMFNVGTDYSVKLVYKNINNDQFRMFAATDYKTSGYRYTGKAGKKFVGLTTGSDEYTSITHEFTYATGLSGASKDGMAIAGTGEAVNSITKLTADKIIITENSADTEPYMGIVSEADGECGIYSYKVCADSEGIVTVDGENALHFPHNLGKVRSNFMIADDDGDAFAVEAGEKYFVSFDYKVDAFEGSKTLTWEPYFGTSSDLGDGKLLITDAGATGYEASDSSFGSSSAGAWKTFICSFTAPETLPTNAADDTLDRLLMTVQEQNGASNTLYIKNVSVGKSIVVFYDNGRKTVDCSLNVGDTLPKGNNGYKNEGFMGWYPEPDFSDSSKMVTTVPVTDDGKVTLFARYPSIVVDFNQINSKITGSPAMFDTSLYIDGNAGSSIAKFHFNSNAGTMVPAYDYTEFSKDGKFFFFKNNTFYKISYVYKDLVGADITKLTAMVADGFGTGTYRWTSPSYKFADESVDGDWHTASATFQWKQPSDFSKSNTKLQGISCRFDIATGSANPELIMDKIIITEYTDETRSFFATEKKTNGVGGVYSIGSAVDDDGAVTFEGESVVKLSHATGISRNNILPATRSGEAYTLQPNKKYYVSFDYYVDEFTGDSVTWQPFYGSTSAPEDFKTLVANAAGTDNATFGTSAVKAGWKTFACEFTTPASFPVDKFGNVLNKIFISVGQKLDTSDTIYIKNMAVGSIRVNYYDNGKKYIDSLEPGDELVRSGENPVGNERFMGWYTVPDFTSEEYLVTTMPEPDENGKVSLFARYPTIVIDFNLIKGQHGGNPIAAGTKTSNNSGNYISSVNGFNESDIPAECKDSFARFRTDKGGVAVSGIMIPAYDYSEFGTNNHFFQIDPNNNYTVSFRYLKSTSANWGFYPANGFSDKIANEDCWVISDQSKRIALRSFAVNSSTLYTDTFEINSSNYNISGKNCTKAGFAIVGGDAQGMIVDKIVITEYSEATEPYMNGEKEIGKCGVYSVSCDNDGDVTEDADNGDDVVRIYHTKGTMRNNFLVADENGDPYTFSAGNKYYVSFDYKLKSYTSGNALTWEPFVGNSVMPTYKSKSLSNSGSGATGYKKSGESFGSGDVDTWKTYTGEFTLSELTQDAAGNTLDHLIFTVSEKFNYENVVYIKNVKVYTACVTFYDNGNKEVVFADIGDTITLPEGNNPFKDDRNNTSESFMGWYTKPDFVTDNFFFQNAGEYTLTEDDATLTLFARYPSTVIDFNLISGTISGNPATYGGTGGKIEVTNHVAKFYMANNIGCILPAYDYDGFDKNGYTYQFSKIEEKNKSYKITFFYSDAASGLVNFIPAGGYGSSTDDNSRWRSGAGINPPNAFTVDTGIKHINTLDVSYDNYSVGTVTINTTAGQSGTWITQGGLAIRGNGSAGNQTINIDKIVITEISPETEDYRGNCGFTYLYYGEGAQNGIGDEFVLIEKGEKFVMPELSDTEDKIFAGWYDYGFDPTAKNQIFNSDKKPKRDVNGNFVYQTDKDGNQQKIEVVVGSTLVHDYTPKTVIVADGKTHFYKAMYVPKAVTVNFEGEFNTGNNYYVNHSIDQNNNYCSAGIYYDPDAGKTVSEETEQTEEVTPATKTGGMRFAKNESENGYRFILYGDDDQPVLAYEGVDYRVTINYEITNTQKPARIAILRDFKTLQNPCGVTGSTGNGPANNDPNQYFLNQKTAELVGKGTTAEVNVTVKNTFDFSNNGADLSKPTLKNVFAISPRLGEGVIYSVTVEALRYHPYTYVDNADVEYDYANNKVKITAKEGYDLKYSSLKLYNIINTEVKTKAMYDISDVCYDYKTGWYDLSGIFAESGLDFEHAVITAETVKKDNEKDDSDNVTNSGRSYKADPDPEKPEEDGAIRFRAGVSEKTFAKYSKLYFAVAPQRVLDALGKTSMKELLDDSGTRGYAAIGYAKNGADEIIYNFRNNVDVNDGVYLQAILKGVSGFKQQEMYFGFIGETSDGTKTELTREIFSYNEMFNAPLGDTVDIDGYRIVREKNGYSYTLKQEVGKLIDAASVRGAAIAEDDNDVTTSNEIVLTGCPREFSVIINDPDKYIIRVQDSRIYLEGGSDRATMMAVTELRKMIEEGTPIKEGFKKVGSYSKEIKKYDEDYMKRTWGDDFTGTDYDKSAWNANDHGMTKIKDKDGNYVETDIKAVMTKGDTYSVGNGTLKMTSRDATAAEKEANPGKDFITPLYMTTQNKMTFLYGTFEVKAKIPFGQGDSSAFWFCSGSRTEDGYGSEIDLVELLGRQDSVVSNLHVWGPTDEVTGETAHAALDGTVDSNLRSSKALEITINPDEWHNYFMTWTPDEIKFGVDGDVYYTIDISDPGDNFNSPNLNMNAFDKPVYLLISQFLYTAGRKSTAANCIGNDVDFSYTMTIDHVDIYQDSTGFIYK